MLFKPTDDPGSDILLGSILTDGGRSLFMGVMLLKPTDDPGSEMTLGSSLTDFAPTSDSVAKSALVGSSIFTEPDEILPPYRGGVLALECMDIRLESSDIARAEGLSRW